MRRERIRSMTAIFRQTKADIDAKLSRIYVRAGDTVEATVAVLPFEDFTVRHGTVDLVCVETYYMRHSEGQPSKHTRDLARIKTDHENGGQKRGVHWWHG